MRPLGTGDIEQAEEEDEFNFDDFNNNDGDCFFVENLRSESIKAQKRLRFREVHSSLQFSLAQQTS